MATACNPPPARPISASEHTGCPAAAPNPTGLRRSDAGTVGLRRCQHYAAGAVARIVPQEESGLVLKADGSWQHDGELATHQGVTRFFHQQIRKDDSGAFYLHNTIGTGDQGVTLEEHVYFEVEDTAYFVLRVDYRSAEAAFELELNTGERVVLDLSSLTQDELGHGYCRVLDGDDARFGRHAMTQLEPFLEAEGEDIYLRAGSHRVRFQARR